MKRGKNNAPDDVKTRQNILNEARGGGSGNGTGDGVELSTLHSDTVVESRVENPLFAVSA